MNHISRHYIEGRNFEKNKSLEDRKSKGVFYTPIEIVDYMARKAIGELDIAANPWVRILDMSCGAGYFLLRCFELLQEVFNAQLHRIFEAHPKLQEVLNHDNIGQFIVEHNLWGADIDPEAVALVKQSLNQAANCQCQSNIICTDSLLDGLGETPKAPFWTQQYHCIIGNPPYLGHKAVPTAYKQELYKHYGEVYKDKSDISYCFFKRGMKLLAEGGILSFITSRYFMEGPSGEGLRAFISRYDITEIIDFGDCRVFEDAGVSVCILTVKKQETASTLAVKKLEEAAAQSSQSLDGLKAFPLSKDQLKKEGWLLLEPEKLELLQKIETQGTYRLEEIMDSSQGIITGCDKAFVLSRQQAAEMQIEGELLRPWIKNSNVGKHFIEASDKVLIYSDLIDQLEDYPRAAAFIGQHKEKLLQRRECQRGVRRWYQLQWGRNKEAFEEEKLVYPYKAAANRFAVDRWGLYCSADVYSLRLKKEIGEKFSLEYIAALLNSRAMEFYFKCIAKKISPTLYDYYPNKVLKLKLKLDEISPIIQDLANMLNSTQKPTERQCMLQAIDREIYRMYDFSERQIKMIENSAGE